jgi:hypothetical protein
MPIIMGRIYPWKEKSGMSKLYMCEVKKLPSGYQYPFGEGDRILILGEIEHMPGHVAIALNDGRVVFGYHGDNFRKLKEDEV